MATLELPENEVRRIEALKKFDILDTPQDIIFDRITQLAATIFRVPVSIISLVDQDRIWFKSHYGLSVNQITRDPGLCSSVILSDKPYAIENAKEDPRTFNNPLVSGNFGLRFYAAVPLQTADGFNLGTICIIDKQPRKFSSFESELLQQLGQITMNEIELRLGLRNAVKSVKNLAKDISGHINLTIKKLEVCSLKEPSLSECIRESRSFLISLQQQLHPNT